MEGGEIRPVPSDVPGEKGIAPGTVNLMRRGADLGRGVARISQAAVAALHSLKERSRNDR